jgi:hypothetical protein
METKTSKTKTIITKGICSELLNENYNNSRYPLIKEAIKKMLMRFGFNGRIRENCNT